MLNNEDIVHTKSHIDSDLTMHGRLCDANFKFSISNFTNGHIFSFTYEEVGPRCGLSKLLLDVFGFEGDKANHRVELDDAPAKEQEVGRSS